MSVFDNLLQSQPGTVSRDVSTLSRPHQQEVLKRIIDTNLKIESNFNDIKAVTPHNSNKYSCINIVLNKGTICLFGTDDSRIIGMFNFEVPSTKSCTSEDTDRIQRAVSNLVTVIEDIQSS